MRRNAKIGLDMLVMVNVLTQIIAVVALLLGPSAHAVLPVIAVGMVLLFLLMYLYARWLFPPLAGRHLLALIAIKEVGVFLWIGLIVGLIAGTRWLVG